MTCQMQRAWSGMLCLHSAMRLHSLSGQMFLCNLLLTFKNKTLQLLALTSRLTVWHVLPRISFGVDLQRKTSVTVCVVPSQSPVFLCRADGLRAPYLPFAPFSLFVSQNRGVCVCLREREYYKCSLCGRTAGPKQAF